MTKRTELEVLEAQILECKKRLKDLEPQIETDEEKSKEYNKIIVQKAILVDDYKKMRYKSTFASKIKKAFKKPFVKKEKLICDYFRKAKAV